MKQRGFGRAIRLMCRLAAFTGLLWYGIAAQAQSSTQTVIADTVQYADGTAVQGSVLLSWPAFTTAAGVAVPKGSTTVLLGMGGGLNVSLAANVGATPVGTFYTAVYHLADGSVSREYWSVPASAQPVKLSAIRTGTLPLTVATQTVSKQYVDQAIAKAAFGSGGMSSSGTLTAVTSAQVISALGYTPAQSSPHLPGMLAYYDLLPSHMSGTTVQDLSGNGNNATLNSGATAGTTGVSFTTAGSISMPAAVNSARTWEYAFELPTLIGHLMNLSTYPTLIGSPSLGGYQLFLSANKGGGNYLEPYGLTLYLNGYVTETSIGIPAGRHVLTVTLGSSLSDPDRFYLDGVEFASYVLHGNSAGKQAGSVLNIGAGGPFGGNSYTRVHTGYEFIARSEELTPAQVATETAAIVADMHARGLGWEPVTWTSNGPYRIHIGDSLTSCTGAGTDTTCWNHPATLTLADTTPAFARAALADTAQPGIGSAALLNSMQIPLAKYCSVFGGPNIVTLWNGTNSLALIVGYTPAMVARDLAAQVAMVRKAGCLPYVMTMISRSDLTNQQGGSLDNDKNALNALIRSQWKAWGATGLIDVAADPNLGADGASTNAQYYTADHVHLNDAGYALVAAAVARALDWSFGYGDAGPHAVSSANYTMAANDGAVNLQPTAATSIRLPSCVGQSGATYRVGNPQNAFPVTLRAVAGSQPVNGVDYSSTGLPVAGNSTLVLRDVPNAGGAAGCHWEM